MRKTPLIFALFSLLIPLQLQAAAETSLYITMNLPEAVIEKSMKQILPLSLEGSSSTLEGTITVMDITDLRIKNQQILFHLDIMGNNLHLVTRVANQDIRLKLGSTRVDFDCDARIRYDTAKQTLFIRPTASDVQGSEALSKGDIGQTLLLFLNGREFPLTMQNLKPIITEASDKIITINTKIVDVKGVEGALQLSLSPTVTASPRQAAVQQ
jgi:hypothetical protein